VENVNISAKKITSRFEKIERVELESDKGVTPKAISVDDEDQIT
jgi:hypothetical protein